MHARDAILAGEIRVRRLSTRLARSVMKRMASHGLAATE